MEMNIAKITASSLFSLLLFFILSVQVGAEDVYTFSGGDISSDIAEEGYENILSALPDDIRDEAAEKGVEAYNIEYFRQLITDALKGAAAPALKTLSVMLSVVILSSVFSMFAKTVGGGGIENVYSLCCILCTAIAIWNIQKGIFDTVQLLLDTLSSTMLIIVPVMESIYITSGNISSAAVSASGVDLMISLCQSLFAKVLAPGASVCFLLSVCASVTKNGGITYMARTLKGLICGTLITVMTLMSFLLALQVSAAQSADNFTQRTIRYAIGSYLPLVGGSVSESFSIIAASLSSVKQMSGAGGIVILLAAFIPPFVLLLLNRFSIGAAGSVAGMLGADGVRDILAEGGSICTLMIAVCAAGAVMYIIAIGIFCKTPVAIG